MKTKTSIVAALAAILVTIPTLETAPVVAFADNAGTTSVTLIEASSLNGDTDNQPNNITIVAPIDNVTTAGPLARTGDALLISATLLALSGLSLTGAAKVESDFENK